jgi:ssDNA-binding Zn-finger/Zn-ribbon topoisomerase 1
MFTHKCAECHQGDMLPTGAFSFNKPFEMHERCPKCDATYHPEQVLKPESFTGV